MDSKIRKEYKKVDKARRKVYEQDNANLTLRYKQELQRAEESVALATEAARVAKEEFTRLDGIFIRGQSQARNYMKKGKLKKGKFIHGENPDTSTRMLEEQERQKRLQWKIWQDAKRSLDLAVADLNKVHGTKLKSGPAAATGMTVAAGEDLLKSLVADTRGPRHQTFWPRGATRKKKSRRSKRRSTKRRHSRRSRKGSTKHRRHSRKRSTKRRRRSRRSRHSRHSHRRSHRRRS